MIVVLQEIQTHPKVFQTSIFLDILTQPQVTIPNETPGDSDTFPSIPDIDVPGYPEIAPSIPDETPGDLGRFPSIPDIDTPGYPDIAPNIPEKTPDYPDTAPSIPDKAPGDPNTAPRNPDVAPGSPKDYSDCVHGDQSQLEPVTVGGGKTDASSKEGEMVFSELLE